MLYLEIRCSTMPVGSCAHGRSKFQSSKNKKEKGKFEENVQFKVAGKVFTFYRRSCDCIFFGFIFFVYVNVNQSSIQYAEQLLEVQSTELAKDIQIELGPAFHSVQVLAQTFQAMIEEDMALTRDEAIMMLKQLLENNPQFLTAWTFWKPDAFDGKDAAYVNEPGHDETGRFISYWSRTDSGFVLEPIQGYDVEGSFKNNLEYVLQTGKSAIFEPYAYDFGGQNVLITSIVYPVVVDGQTLGMVGIDYSLESIHERVSQITFYKTGFAALLSNEGTVISHKNLISSVPIILKVPACWPILKRKKSDRPSSRGTN